MSNPAISSEEFQQKLQAGQINEALVLVLSQANLLDVTTQITDDINTKFDDSLSLENKIAPTKFPKSEYLRTKINLITGEIHNEVGRDLIVKSISYIRLQQLHIDRIVASHRIVQGYLHQIQGILTALDSTQSRSGLESELATEEIWEGSNIADALPTRLAEAFRAILSSTPSNLTENSNCLPTEPAATSTEILNQPDLPSSTLPDPIAEDIHAPRRSQSPSSQPIVSPVAFDDGIDLSIDENTVVWEEWVEDEEDFTSEPAIRNPALAAESLTIPDWGEDWDRRQLDPITVKLTIPRTPAAVKSVDSSEKWDQFMPEHVGIYIDPKPNPLNNPDPHQIDRLLADLDKISKGQEIK